MHSYIIGKTGSGKTTFLQSLILDNEGGFAVFDPHGDLAQYVASTVDCIYFNPSDTQFPVGFNVLENVLYENRPLVASQVISAMKAVWADSWGPRLEYVLVNCLRVLLDNSLSLIAVPRMLTDISYRVVLLKRCSDPVVLAFFENEFDAWDDRFRREAISPIQNKIGQLASNPTLRNILSHNTLNLRKIMDSGQRLVVNLSKGALGDEPSHLLGALLVSGFASAAAARASIPENERVPFIIYADEFQNFATESFAVVLSESRKYRLSMVLAHQFLGQLPESLRKAVFGNVGTFIAFQTGAEDALMIAKELGLPNPEVLVDLEHVRGQII